MIAFSETEAQERGRIDARVDAGDELDLLVRQERYRRHPVLGVGGGA